MVDNLLKLFPSKTLIFESEPPVKTIDPLLQLVTLSHLPLCNSTYFDMPVPFQTPNHPVKKPVSTLSVLCIVAFIIIFPAFPLPNEPDFFFICPPAKVT